MNFWRSSAHESTRVSVIAEAGVNHNGDVDLAHRLVDAAAACDADAVKFQTFDPALLTSTLAASTPYQAERGGAATQTELLGSLVLPESAWQELAAHSQEAGIAFLSTPFDPRSADTLCTLGVDALKVGSGDLTNLPFLRQLAGLGKPLIVSTGMGTLAEVAAAVEACDAAPGLVLLHCVTAYPAPEDQCNLRAITTMSDAFDVPVGWSDHTTGQTSSLVAVSLGARVLEKHLTLDRSLPGPDHLASLEPSEMADYVRSSRAVVAMLGDGVKRRMPVEEENASLVRRSWHTLRGLPAGHVLVAEDLIALRPEAGVSVAVPVVGATLQVGLQAGDAVTPAALGWGG